MVALLVPGSALVAEEGGADHAAPEHEPITLRGERIPAYEVFETFLLHASVLYETRGPDAYRELVVDYGLNPDLEAVQDLPRAFDELESSRETWPDADRATWLGKKFAQVLTAVENDPDGVEDSGRGRGLRVDLLQRFRPKMGWTFVDEHPNFVIIDEAEEAFRAALAGSGGVPSPQPVAPKHGGEDHETEVRSGIQVKISHLGDPSDWHKSDSDTSHATFEWRRYANDDGSVRVIALIDRGAEPQSLVDMRFPTDEHLRQELKFGGTDGVLRFAEDFRVDLQSPEKSHTTLGCIAAEAAAVLACIGCASPPNPITCSACVIAIGAAAAACTQPHCDQIQCNANCVQGCHLYGICSDTSGSSSPADCSCVGQRYDIPGCELPCLTSGPLSALGIEGLDPIICHPCSVTVPEVAMLRLDGSDPVELPIGAVTLRRLEASDMVHGGDPVSYLMGEWAVVDFGAPEAATKSIRTLRSSSPEFGASQARMLSGRLAESVTASAGPADRLAIMVAVPPHEANSRKIPMPTLKVRADGLPADVGQGRVAIRADFAESGDLQDFEVLADTLGGVSPELAEQIARALSLERASEKEHRVVTFAVLSIGDALTVESDLPYLPKCCCGDQFCV